MGKRVLKASYEPPTANEGWVCPALECLVFGSSTRVTKERLETLVRFRVRDVAYTPMPIVDEIVMQRPVQLATMFWGERDMILETSGDADP